MELLLNNIWRFIFMLVLLAASGTFSGSETAFFNISSRKARAFRKSRNNLENIAGLLLAQPKKLLTSLLLGNMIVNVCYFSLVSSFLVQNGEKLSHAAVAGFTVFFFFMLLLFGEMLPKSLAFKNSGTLCMILALPCYFCVKILYPIQRTFSVLIIEPILRLSGWGRKKSRDLSHDQLKQLIESTKDTGLITGHENMVLTRIIEMNVLKVRHILKPRVDMVFCDVNDTPENVIRLLGKSEMSFATVYKDEIDNVKGIVFLIYLAANAGKPISKLIQPIPFIPEQKSVESTVVYFQKNKIERAMAVDEYGGIVGFVGIEDIIELLLGETGIETAGNIEKIEEDKYRLPGDMQLNEWAQAFGIANQQTRLSTLAGLVIAKMDKTPSPGDSIKFHNLELTVENVDNRRIKSVILELKNQDK